MRVFTIGLIALALTGCAGKTRLVPQAYMPEPPAILMQPPKDLKPIKNNLEVTETSVAVSGPKS